MKIYIHTGTTIVQSIDILSAAPALLCWIIASTREVMYIPTKSTIQIIAITLTAVDFFSYINLVILYFKMILAENKKNV